MPMQMKTPGVYIVEKNAFPPSVVAVETAVPAFVGYTGRAEFKSKTLTNIPFKVTSMTEFETAFGRAPKPRFRIDGPSDASGAPLAVAPQPNPWLAGVPASEAGGPTDAEVKLITAWAVAQTAGAAANAALAPVAAPPAKTAGAAAKTAGPAAQSAADPFVNLPANAALTPEQKTALAALQDWKPASLPAAITPQLLAASVLDALTKAPAAQDKNLSADEVAAIKSALAVVVKFDDPKKQDLANVQPGAPVAANLQAALTALKTAAAAPVVPDPAGSPLPRANDPLFDPNQFKVVRADDLNRQYQLWYAMRMFFDNGGGPCWIVSVGTYDDPIDVNQMKAGIETLKDELEPTMLVIPDAIKLSERNCIALQQAMLKHCGEDMKNRIAILDIYDGDQPLQPTDPVAAFRDHLGVNNLNFGAAYYPWLNTVVNQDRDISFLDFLDKGDQTKLAASVDKLLIATTPPGPLGLWFWTQDQIMVPSLQDGTKQSMRAFMMAALTTPYDQLTLNQKSTIDQVNGLFAAMFPVFKVLCAEAVRKLNVLPPSGAMAGLYTFVDNNRGVWKAPANVSVNNAVSPCVPISNYLQQDLNITPMGKSINAIRSFIGEGVLVWGARTLDGNSQDWRYINVRRTMIFLEESCRLAAKRMVFEPNVSSTWVTIKAMIDNFLHSVWRQGGLAGAVPEDAYSVHVGLGDTMTADDILEGILRVTVLVAISRPAEFIEITFQQQLQKS